jgi:cytochrome c biogenesis protein CcmG, thiol:disulfide interchange protein DsbE
VTAVTDAPAPPPDPGASSPPPARFRMTPTRWIAAALVVTALAFLVVLATRQSAQEAAAGSPLLGKPAPEVIGPDLDGETVRLSQLRGRYVLLNFFASWCVPCEREHDDLIRFQEAHAEAGDATVLAVIFDDTVENAQEFFEERGGDWPVLADERGKVSLDFGVRGPPESFLISPEGIVLTRIIGEVDSDRLERLLTEAERLRAEARAEAEAES